jgi:DUF4097 and DUF4098 domain-containing protein YvlB
MTKAQRRMLVLGVLPVILLVLGGAALTVETIRGKLNYDYSETYAKPSTTVSIAANVQVSASPSDDDKVHVSLSGTYTGREPTVETRANAVRGELAISAHCIGSGCRLELDVALPDGVQLSADTSEASITLLRLSGQLRIKSDGGSINAVRLLSDKVSVTSVSGSVDLGFDRPPTEVQADTSDGSVSVLVPRTATYAIDAAAAHGSTTLNAASDPGSKHRLRLRAAGGSITVDAN